MTPPATVDVLQVVPTLEVGGLERMAAALCYGLRDRFNLGIVCLKGEGAFADELREAGVPVFSCAAPGRFAPHTAFLRLRRLVRERRVRLVHTHNTGPFMDGTLATLGLNGLPLVHTDHARDFPDKWKYMTAERLCAGQAFRVVAVSEHGKRNLEQYERIAPDRIAVIPNGVNTAPFAALDPPAPRPERPIVVGAAVRFTDQKDLGTLIDAAARVMRKGRAIRLRFAGDGPQRAALEAQAARLGIADRVDFLGYRTDVPAVLSELDVYAVSSVWEGMPLGVIEAMAAARPVVATCVGGVPEVVEDGRTGLLVPAGNPAAFAEALDRLVTDFPFAATLGREARAVAVDRFSLAAMTEKYAALYTQALGGERAA